MILRYLSSPKSFPVWFVIAAWVGTRTSVPLPLWIGIGGFGLALLLRRRTVLLVATLLLASIGTFNANQGLRPLANQPFEGRVTLVRDPGVSYSQTRVDVRTSVGRVELGAWGPSGTRLSRLSAGDSVYVSGTISPLTHPERARSRHVRARLVVQRLDSIRRAGVPLGLVNVARSVVLAGGQTLSDVQRPVYGGFLLGDDRGRSPQITTDFKRAGLTHLLVVSGQNVAFLIAVASPVLTRLQRRTRLLCLLSLLLLFVAMTRFEPSILRATAMAVVAGVGVAGGRPMLAVQRLAVGIGVLLLLDPLLSDSFGFRLSVAATLGIITLGSWMAPRFSGPEWFRNGLAVTLSAQCAVAPLIVPIFGPMRVISIPANVIVGPVAGFVMMWGTTVGVLAGLFGGAVSAIIQSPVRVALWWILWVAHVASALPSPSVDLPMIGAIVAGVVVFLQVRSRRRARHGTALPG